MLRRFWFPAKNAFGIGVTAESLEKAFRVARECADRNGWDIQYEHVIVDVDIRELDQDHVIPNMGPSSNCGIWFPKENL